MTASSPCSDGLTLVLWAACRHQPPSRDLMLASCGRLATAVGMGPLKGMSREMVFVKSGLALGLISPVNDPLRKVSPDQVTFSIDGENHGMGDQAASDAATANLR